MRPDTGGLYEHLRVILVQAGKSVARARTEAEMVAAWCGKHRTGWYDCPEFGVVITDDPYEYEGNKYEYICSTCFGEVLDRFDDVERVLGSYDYDRLAEMILAVGKREAVCNFDIKDDYDCEYIKAGDYLICETENTHGGIDWDLLKVINQLKTD